MPHDKEKMHFGILILTITAFAIGVSEFIVVGILPAIAADLSISIVRTGNLVGLYAFALAIGSPLVVLTLASLPRKPTLLALIFIFFLGNLLVSLSRTYEWLLLGRIITAVAHGSFFGIAATVAANLAPRGQASKAIAIMFAGLTLAMIVGIPFGSYLGNGFSWRIPFYSVTIVSLFALIATALWLPTVPAAPAGKIIAQLAALKTPEILAMMMVTILGFGATFPAFTYITPILTNLSGFSITAVSALLLVFGFATFIGNLAGGWVMSKISWQTSLQLMFILLALTLALFALTLFNKNMAVVILFIWGVLAFGISPGFQAGMLTTAEKNVPSAVSFASALNIAAFNLGISFGERVGSFLVTHGLMGYTPWAGVIIIILAQLPLAWLKQRQ